MVKYIYNIWKQIFKFLFSPKVLKVAAFGLLSFLSGFLIIALFVGIFSIIPIMICGFDQEMFAKMCIATFLFGFPFSTIFAMVLTAKYFGKPIEI